MIQKVLCRIGWHDWWFIEWHTCNLVNAGMGKIGNALYCCQRCKKEKIRWTHV